MVVCRKEMNTEMQTGTVAIGDSSLYVLVEGEGPATIVTPVAWGMSHDFYRLRLEPLDLPLHLIYFDAQGTGQSAPLPAGWDPAAIVDEAEAVRAWSGHEQVLLLGHGSGAFLSIAYALEYPHRVQAMILVAPFASYQRANDLGAGRMEASPQWETFRQRAAEIRRVPLTSEDRFRAIFKEQRMVDMYDYSPYYFEMAEAADSASFNPVMHDDAQIDFLDELHTIKAPVLIIAGIHDPLSPVEESRLIASELPYVRLLEFQASGHFPFVEEAGYFKDAVKEFVRELPLGAEVSGRVERETSI